MICKALLYSIDGAPHVLVDTADNDRVERELIRMTSLFPQNRPEIVSVEISEEDRRTLPAPPPKLGSGEHVLELEGAPV